MANLSQKKRERMLAFLNTLKEQHKDNDNTLIAINEIENALNEKKYGLVWEKHEEAVDVKMQTHIPVFTENKDMEITMAPGKQYNFLLEGDNLHSLRLLEKTHRGKIDMIYIDPPYNRGKNDFRYDDKFIGQEDSFKHSKWLSFMDERLKIAHNLLSDDGAIFISIDDNEQAPLKMLCDDIFSQDNFLGTIIQNKLNSKNDTTDLQKNHEYILVYRRKTNLTGSGSKNKIKPTLVNAVINTKRVEFEDGEYFYLNDPITTRGEGGVLAARNNLGYSIYYNESTQDIIPRMDYDMEKINTDDENKVYHSDKELVNKGYVPIRPPRVRGHLGAWTWELPRVEKDKKNLYIKKGSKGYTVKSRTFVNPKDVYKKGDKYYINIVTYDNYKSIIEFSTNDGSTQLANVIGESGSFNNPKNVNMIKSFINLIPKRDAKILDFFAGSGTTAQAVLELNEKDGGHRSFILCTNNENNICQQVTYRRIKNVISGYEYDGKRKDVLFTKKITMKCLKDSDNLLDKINDTIEENKNRYDNIKTTIKDGNVIVFGEQICNEKVEGIPANLKYYHTDFVSKDEEFLSDVLLEHVAEMIQLEHGIKLDGKQYIMVLSDEEADRLAAHWDEYPDVKALYVADQVLFTTEQERLFKNVEIYTIPDYYFNFELQEVGETW